MKRLYWFVFFILILLALAVGYAFNKIPKSEQLSGRLTYAYANEEVQPDTTFHISLESRAQGESLFSILSASKDNELKSFPQHFRLPVLNSLLSVDGVYQIRVQVLHGGKVLYANKGLIPLAYEDLFAPIEIELQVPSKPRKKIIIPTETNQVVMSDSEIESLLANKVWLLQTDHQEKPHLRFDTSKEYAYGHGGCNKFQGRYQLQGKTILFNQFIRSSQQCKGVMHVEEHFLSALTKTTHWRVKKQGKKLALYGKDGQQLLQFIAE